MLTPGRITGAPQIAVHGCVLTTLTHHTVFWLSSGKILYSYDQSPVTRQFLLEVYQARCQPCAYYTIKNNLTASVTC